MKKPVIQISLGNRIDGKKGVGISFLKNWKPTFAHNLSEQEARWLAARLLGLLPPIRRRDLNMLINPLGGKKGSYIKGRVE